MARSDRTQKESLAAARLIERDADGRPRIPRVIERAPTPGDSHPIPKRVLQRVLRDIPIEYVYGLSRIELRARHEPGVGAPFGCYRPDERAILLYSLPPVWHFPAQALAGSFGRSLQRFYARIDPDSTGVNISWPEPAVMSLWFYSYVLTHELGHHFVEQYKAKNSRIQPSSAEELVAELHAQRLTDKLLVSLRTGRKG